MHSHNTVIQFGDCLPVEITGKSLALCFQALLNLSLGGQAAHELVLLLRQLVYVLLQCLKAPVQRSQHSPHFLRSEYNDFTP